MNEGSKKLSWDDFQIVKAIAENGTLAAAASQVGVNQSTAFRRLGHIEQALGALLFERRRSGYVATPAGAEVIALAQRLEFDIVAVTNRVSGLHQEPAGDLRITMSDTLACWLVMPILAEFKTLYPAVRIELAVGNGLLNLARGECDIAVRATDHPPENLFGRKVARIAWAAYGRRADYAGGCPAPDELHDRSWVSYSGELSSLKAVGFVDTQVSPRNVCFRINTVNGLAAAVSTGLGAGYLPCILGDAHPNLTRIAPPNPHLSDDLWLLTHPDLRKSGRVHAVLNHCATAISRLRPFIEGAGSPPSPP